MTTSKIEWTDRVWNPVTGCTKVSAGCKNCYAETFAGRGIGSFSGGRKFTDVRTHADRLDAPLRWRKPQRVFVNSMSDLFHRDVPDEFIDDVFATMIAAQRHTFQVLTKRPQRMRDYMHARGRALHDPHGEIGQRVFDLRAALDGHRSWPPANVWLGVSCEDQRAADERIQALLQTPAAVRFVSAEPLLGPVDLRRIDGTGGRGTWDVLRCAPTDDGQRNCGTGIDWVIVGGESGPGARPCEVAWIRSIVEQCRTAVAPVFVKQYGSNARGDRFDMSESAFVDADAAGWDENRCRLPLRDRKGGNMEEWDPDLRVREFPREVTE